MKRLLPLALALLLLLSACAAPSEFPSVTTGGETNPPAVTTGGETNPPAVTTGGETNPPAVTTGGETAPPETLPGGFVEVPPQIDEPNITANSLTEYEKMLTDFAKVLPADFVPYEKIASYGSFETFVCTDTEEMKRYHYILNDGSGKQVTIGFLPREDRIQSETLVKMRDEDRRFYSDKEAFGLMTVGEMEYHYLKGTLSSVYILFGDRYVRVTASKLLSDYPIDAKTPISALLRASTAKEAAEALLAKIEK